MVRYWKYVLVAVVLAAVFSLLGIANVVAPPHIKKFVMGGTFVAAIAVGIIGATFGIGWAKRTTERTR